MVDNTEMVPLADQDGAGPPADNIRTLVYYFGLLIDDRLRQMRKGSVYEWVRPSDIRIFVTAAREPLTLSGVARQLQITRQAVQLSVRRLQKLGVVILEPREGNKREKLIVITQRGRLARQTAARQIMQLEQKFAEDIGPGAYQSFRQSLTRLVGRQTGKNSAL